MKRTLAIAGLALAITTTTASAYFNEPHPVAQCEVRVDNPTDPTLNARTRPNGLVLDIFVSGEIVNTFDRQGDWIYVEGAVSDGHDKGNYEKHGWVFGPYLSNCRPAAG
jgi:hypothetical protein